MSTLENTPTIGAVITQLVAGADQLRPVMREIFDRVLDDKESAMDQGALLAALAAKGETADEIAAAWESVYELDTARVSPAVEGPLCENSGTGMDAVKTFNISTAAAVIAASQGVVMARHGARAITSTCGTVDMAETLGVDVEVAPEVVAGSIESCGIGLFNGMSPLVHPHALGRILSQITFGSILNIAASLANPANPTIGVRGVNRPEMVEPVARIMAEVGYIRALVVHGLQADGSAGIDEVGNLGETVWAELLPGGEVRTGRWTPEDLGVARCEPADLLASRDREAEARRLVAILRGERTGADADIVCLNAAAILLVAGKASTMAEGLAVSRQTCASGAAFTTLEKWVRAQSLDAEASASRLAALVAS